MEFLPKETKEGAPVPGCSCFFILKMELSVPLGSHSAVLEGEVKREKRKQMPVPLLPCAGFANCSLGGPELS